MTNCRRRISLRDVFAGVLTMSLLLSSDAPAEVYVGGQLGFSTPLNFDMVEGRGSASSTDAIQLSNSFLYGGKVGYFLPSFLNWLGVEADIYRSTPDLKQHAFTLAGAGGTSTTVVEGIHLGMTTLALRVVLRSPGRNPEDPDKRFEPGAALWERFEPYGALGPAFFFTHTSTKGGASDDTSLGASLALGSRFFLKPQLALFAEYKLDAATLTFQNALAPGAGLRGDYVAHNLAVGISYHFQGL